jgi:hypothetical protein
MGYHREKSGCLTGQRSHPENSPMVLISLWEIPGLVVGSTQTQRPGAMTAYHRQKSGLEKRVKTKGYPLAILQTPDERPATQTSPSGKLPDVIFSIFIFGPPSPHPVTPVPGLFYRYHRGISRTSILSPLVRGNLGMLLTSAGGLGPDRPR